MIDPDPVGGGNADLDPNDVGFAMDQLNTFMGRRATPERLEREEMFYRVYNDPARMQGKFLTSQYLQALSRLSECLRYLLH